MIEWWDAITALNTLNHQSVKKLSDLANLCRVTETKSNKMNLHTLKSTRISTKQVQFIQNQSSKATLWYHCWKYRTKILMQNNNYIEIMTSDISNEPSRRRVTLNKVWEQRDIIYIRTSKQKHLYSSDKNGICGHDTYKHDSRWFKAKITPFRKKTRSW